MLSINVRNVIRDIAEAEKYTRALKGRKKSVLVFPFTERATGHATDLRGSMRGTGPIIVIHDRALISSFNHRMKLNRMSSIIKFLVENVSVDVHELRYTYMAN